MAELTDAWIGGWAKEEPAEALDWWLDLGEENPSPEVAKGLRDWTIYEPREMQEWVGKLPEGPAKENLKLLTIPTLLKSDFPDQATEMVLSVKDDGQRMEQIKELRRHLKEFRPGYFDSLLPKFSEEERAKLLEK